MYFKHVSRNYAYWVISRVRSIHYNPHGVYTIQYNSTVQNTDTQIYSYSFTVAFFFPPKLGLGSWYMILNIHHTYSAHTILPTSKRIAYPQFHWNYVSLSFLLIRDWRLELGGVFLDIAKAFDTVNHRILLRKLEYYGLRGKTLMWFESYLTNREYHVNIRKHQSENYTLKYGIPYWPLFNQPLRTKTAFQFLSKGPVKKGRLKWGRLN